jgi:hypothetical protein
MDSCGMLFATMVDDVVHGYPSLTLTHLKVSFYCDVGIMVKFAKVIFIIDTNMVVNIKGPPPLHFNHGEKGKVKTIISCF